MAKLQFEIGWQNMHTHNYCNNSISNIRNLNEIILHKINHIVTICDMNKFWSNK